MPLEDTIYAAWLQLYGVGSYSRQFLSKTVKQGRYHYLIVFMSLIRCEEHVNDEKLNCRRENVHCFVFALEKLRYITQSKTSKITNFIHCTVHVIFGTRMRRGNALGTICLCVCLCLSCSSSHF